MKSTTKTKHFRHKIPITDQTLVLNSCLRALEAYDQ